MNHQAALLRPGIIAWISPHCESVTQEVTFSAISTPTREPHNTPKTPYNWVTSCDHKCLRVNEMRRLGS